MMRAILIVSQKQIVASPRSYWLHCQQDVTEDKFQRVLDPNWIIVIRWNNLKMIKHRRLWV